MIAAAAIVVLRLLWPAAPPDRFLPGTRAMPVSAHAPNQSTTFHPVSVPAANDSPATNLIARLLRGDTPKLTAEQIEPFLQQNHRNAGSLLAAFLATDDRAYLLEAMEKFPNDPRVDLLAYYRGVPGADYLREPASEERRKWLDAFQQSDPDNVLPGLLSARDRFKAGQPELALQEFGAALEKPNLQDYLRDSIQNTEEAYRLAGYSEAEAKTFAMNGLRLRHWAEVQRLGADLLSLGHNYRQAGDESSAQAAFQMAAQLAARVDQPGSLTILPSYIGIMVQRDVLQSMDPTSPYGTGGQTVQDRIDALNQRYSALGGRAKQVREILPTLPDADFVNYMDRTLLLGEEAAQGWLLNKYPPAASGR